MRVSNPTTSHTQLTGVTADNHHTENHRVRHLDGGADALGFMTGAVKAANGSPQTVTNSTTFVNVTTASFSVGGSETWYARFALDFLSPGPAGIKFRLTMSVAMTFVVTARCYDGSTASVVTYTRSVTSGDTLSFQAVLQDYSSKGYAEIELLLQGSGAGGTVTLAFAQSTADVGNTTINSHQLTGRRLA